jgi:hypothetical protein
MDSVPVSVDGSDLERARAHALYELKAAAAATLCRDHSDFRSTIVADHIGFRVDREKVHSELLGGHFESGGLPSFFLAAPIL